MYTISHIKNFRQDSAPPCISVAESATAPETFADLTRPALRYYFRGVALVFSAFFLTVYNSWVFDSHKNRTTLFSAPKPNDPFLKFFRTQASVGCSIPTTDRFFFDQTTWALTRPPCVFIFGGCGCCFACTRPPIFGGCVSGLSPPPAEIFLCGA